MNRHINNLNLPAGLLDGNCEFFSDGTDVYALYDGKTWKFEEFPAELIEMLNNDIQKYPDAIVSLIELDLVDPTIMLKQYARCRFGGFDGEADIENGQLIHTEYWECGLRGKCKHEGKLCQSIKVGDKFLTKREIEVLKCIGEGMLDKEIAAHLNISELTVPGFTKSIREKTGLSRKADLMKFIVKKNII